MKKIFSALIALTLVLTLSVMAFAAPEKTAYDKLLETVHSDASKAAIKTVLDAIDPTSEVYEKLIATVHTDEFKAGFKAIIEGTEDFDTTKIAGLFDDFINDTAAATGVKPEVVKEALAKSGLFDWVAKLYMPATPETTTAATTTVAPTIAPTGSATGGIAIFATISVAAAAAFVCIKKN